MRKRFSALLMLAVLLFALTVPAFAQETESFVIAEEGYLTQDEVLSLNSAAAAVSAENGCGVYVAVFDDMTAYDYYNIEVFAEAVYTELELGFTEDGDGILLVMSMAERDYDVVAYGSFANLAFTDYGKEELARKFLPYFRENDWAGGFAAYIEGCAELLSFAGSGAPLDVFNAGDYGYDDGYTTMPLHTGPWQRVKKALPAGLIAGLIAALIYVAVLKKKMKSAVTATEASEYVCRNGVEMHAAFDRFSHTTVVHQHIDRDSGSGSHHSGGTSVNSGGFSHSRGKF